MKYKLDRSINASQVRILWPKDTLYQKESELEAWMQKARKKVKNTDEERVVVIDDIERIK